MMNRSTFNETLKSLVERILGDNYIVELQNVTKVNVTLTALVVRKTNSTIGVTIYIDSLYEEYRTTGEEVNYLASKLLNRYHSEILEASLSVSDLDVLKDKRSRIFYKVINRDKNEELLKNVPYIQAVENSDLVLIFCILVDECKDMSATVTITNHLMGHFNFTLSELITVAKENTPKLFPASFRSMSEVIANLLPIFSAPDETDDTMWVLSNTRSVNGAGAMYYEHMLEDIAGRLNGNFFVLPSSLHEVIIVKDDNGVDTSFLCEMVKEVNQTSVEDEDFLSDTVFYYNNASHILSIA